MYESLMFFQQGLLLSALLSAPPLITATLFGLLISLLLTVFQIQEQTLPFVVKLVSVTITLLLCGRWIATEIVQMSLQIMASISSVGR